MSDTGSLLGSIADAGKDFVKETKKQITTGVVASAASQLIGIDTEEDIAKRKAEKMNTFARIKQIEAEMAQLRSIEEQEKNMQKVHEQKIVEKKASMQGRKEKKMDEASRQAVGKSELGRNYKG